MSLIRALFTSRFFYILLIYICHSGSYAQNNYGEITWTLSTTPSKIPDSLKNEDAVMIYKTHSLTNERNGSFEFQHAESVFCRIKFLTENGVEKYSKIALAKNGRSSISQLDARTIKPDGKVIDLKSSQIKRMDFEIDKKEDFDIQYYRFSIPGVEPGDEVEFGYTIESPGINLGKDFFFNADIPCLNSTFCYAT